MMKKKIVIAITGASGAIYAKLLLDKLQQLSGQIKQHWGKLTDDDLKVAEGNSEYLSGKLQERYGMARDEAEKQVKAFEKQIRHH